MRIESSDHIHVAGACLFVMVVWVPAAKTEGQIIILIDHKLTTDFRSFAKEGERIIRAFSRK